MMPNNTLLQPISISSESEFFIAVCTYKVHSYITLGVKNKEEVNVLASIGKKAHQNTSPCHFIFGNADASLNTEPFMFGTKKNNEVSYKAFSISYKHYIEFIAYLKNVARSQRQVNQVKSLHAYLPESNNPSRLLWSYIENFSSNESTLSDEDRAYYSHINVINNSCRHGAIRLAQHASHRKDLGESASTCFFKSLPLTAIFCGGTVTKATPYFYILPMPPTAFEGIDSKKAGILNQLYKRLDEIVLSEQQNPVTIQKFQKIKQLYIDLTQDDELPLLSVINGIETWERENQALIATHRKSHWFSFQTATQKMFAQLHDDFTSFRQEFNCKPT